MWAVIVSVQAIASFMWDISGSMLDVASSLWTIVSSMWAVSASVWVIAGVKQDARLLCGLLIKPSSLDSALVQAFQVEAKH